MGSEGLATESFSEFHAAWRLSFGSLISGLIRMRSESRTHVTRLLDGSKVPEMAAKPSGPAKSERKRPFWRIIGGVPALGTSNQFVVPEESEVVPLRAKSEESDDASEGIEKAGALVGALVSALHQGTLPSLTQMGLVMVFWSQHLETIKKRATVAQEHYMRLLSLLSLAPRWAEEDGDSPCKQRVG